MLKKRIKLIIFINNIFEKCIIYILNKLLDDLYLEMTFFKKSTNLNFHLSFAYINSQLNNIFRMLCNKNMEM